MNRMLVRWMVACILALTACAFVAPAVGAFRANDAGLTVQSPVPAQVNTGGKHLTAYFVYDAPTVARVGTRGASPAQGAVSLDISGKDGTQRPVIPADDAATTLVSHTSTPSGTPSPGTTSGSVTRTGVKRTNPSDWRRTRDVWDQAGYDDILSEANRKFIAQGKTPIVDDAWIRHFPGDEALRGQKITMHHIGGSPITIPLPTSRHLDAHMPGGFRYNPGGPGATG